MKQTVKFKRTLVLLFIGVISLTTSCSSDNQNEKETQSTNTILVKKIIKTYRLDDISILTYKYDGNKIVSESSDGGFIATYTYTGNVITKIEEKVNDKFQRSYEYTYLNGRVAKEVEKSNCCGTNSYSYIYNSNGTVSYIRTRTGSENTTGLLTITNGNIVKDEEFYGGQYPSTSTYLYEYDDKNNPFKNVLGFNLLLNVHMEMFSATNMTMEGSGTPPFNYTFKYDTNGFPTEKKLSSGNQNESYQYFY